MPKPRLFGVPFRPGVAQDGTVECGEVLVMQSARQVFARSSTLVDSTFVLAALSGQQRGHTRRDVSIADERQSPQLKIRVLVVNDSPLERDGTRALLSTQPDFLVIEEADLGPRAVRQVLDLKPDIVLLDLSMNKASGHEFMRGLREARASVRLILSMQEASRKDIVTLLALGARGVLLKESPVESVFKSIRHVHAGEVWIDRRTVADVVDAFAPAWLREQTTAPRHFGLTLREREVLTLVLEGETNKGIAERLSIGHDTVKHHMTNVFNKTGVSNRLELALFALHHRLLQSD
jgi:two-component system nitrate/nitrite response regulator NarL